jgi:hypothetical protein
MKIIADRETKDNPVPMILECKDRSELYKHLICTEKVSQITLLLSARIEKTNESISPAHFITEESFAIVSLFSQFKRYGLQALYADGDCPAIVMQAFDVIQNVIDRKNAPETK